MENIAARDVLKRVVQRTSPNTDMSAIRNTIRKIDKYLKENSSSAQSITAQFLRDQYSGSKVAESRGVASLLGLLSIAGRSELLVDILGSTEDTATVLRALLSLEAIGGEQVPDEVLACLDSSNPQVRAQALRAIAVTGDANSMSKVVPLLLDTDPEISQLASRCVSAVPTPPADPDLLAQMYRLWLQSQQHHGELVLAWVSSVQFDCCSKVTILLQELRSSAVTPGHFDPSVVHALARDPSGNVQIPTLVGCTLERVVSMDHEPREYAIIAQLLIELLGTNEVGRKATAEAVAQKMDSLSDDAQAVRLADLLAAVAEGDAAVAELDRQFVLNYVKVTADLAEATIEKWEAMVRQAHLAFVVRLWMSIAMFGLGFAAATIGLVKYGTGRGPDLESLLASGGSLVSGLATMAASFFLGPLREIARSVADVSILNTTLIGYVHRILQISHTFEYIYLTRRVDLNSLQATTDLIDQAMSAAGQHLSALLTDSRRDLAEPTE